MRGPPARQWLCRLGIWLAASAITPSLEARVEARTGYTKAQTYTGALRYLRVDLGYEVTEKDADAAYVLFRFEASGKRELVNGSVEIVEAGDEVKLLVQIAELPVYYETVLRDGLLRKLRDEYGEPVSKPKDEPKEPPGDGPNEGDKPGDKDQPKEKPKKPSRGSER